MSTPTPHSNDTIWRVDYQNCTGSQAQSADAVPVLVSAKGNNVSKWSAGERLHHLFEQQCDKPAWHKRHKQIAVEYPHESFSFKALDKLSNQFARFLIERGVEPGARVALLIDRSIYSHAIVLAMSKIGAAYVPLDASFPTERIDFIVKDSGVSLVLTLSQFMERFQSEHVPAIALDAHRDDIDRQKTSRLPTSSDAPADSLCYVIYTSGTTGRPKGVPINHSSICNFLHVAKESYQYQATDRVYQGMTIAFDYSVEELWVPLISGATLIPAPSGGNLVGEDLAEFIRAREITAMCCVPTLLASIESELPGLRFLMVSGEACPADLAKHWNRKGVRFLNTYGPTEATVSATWMPVETDDDITIGGPLPTYSIVILNQDEDSVCKLGETGELCIAGIGLSDGYLGLPEQTGRVFIDDFIGLANNPGGKIYRTGDLGLINSDNQIEFRGRVDTQVKIRGYRIELGEIESVLRDVSGVRQAVVNTFETEGGNTELVAYYIETDDVLDVPTIQTKLREQLPAYMVPAFFEAMTQFPTLTSGKLDRKSLPIPASNRLLATGKAYVAPVSQTETDLAEQLAAVLQIDLVSTDADFFDDLAADSLLIAQFVARLRKNLGVKRLSLKKIYQHPTIQQLAEVVDAQQAKAKPAPVADISAKVAAATAAPGEDVPVRTLSGVQNDATPQTDEPEATDIPEITPHIASRFEHISCGVMQAAYFVAAAWVSAYALLLIYNWINLASGVVEVFARSLLAGSAYFVGVSFLLIAIKWIAIGRFDDSQTIPVWSVKYVRFWIARTAIRANPLNLARGTPLYSWYLRMLGAKIGKRVTFFARTPTCVDLLTIGDDTVIRQDANVTGYNVMSGHIRPGPIDIGSRVYVGEATVLDINTKIGDDAQLGTSSCLHEYHQVPAGKIYQGSPAVESTTNFNKLPPLEFSQSNRNVYSAYLIGMSILLAFPLLFSAMYVITSNGLSLFESSATNGIASTLGWLLIASIGLYVGGVSLNIARVMIVPRLIRPFLIVDKVHPLFGVQYHLATMMTVFSTSVSLNRIFGDSAMILHYLRYIGYDMSEATQTGSNFGVDQRHNSPFLCKFGRNTLVSDGLRLMNIEASNSSFKISQITMPADTYLGNTIHYPVDSRIGANCLIATKAMVPIDGPIREDVGVLGSPPFEIPRSVMRDQKFDHFKEPTLLKKRLKMKLRSNLWTLAMYVFRTISEIFIYSSFAFAVWHLPGIDSISNFAKAGVIMALGIVSTAFHITYGVVYEKFATQFKKMKPLYCSLYDQEFWDHERYWKMSVIDIITIFAGTPFKPVILRMRGMKIGRMYFDDGAGFPEPELITIGDNCCFNVQSTIQNHSLEDGTFKSDYVTVGDNCNFGVGAFVHYGAKIESNTSILADSFVMKGTIIGKDSTWGGNPARENSSSDFDAAEIANAKASIQITGAPSPGLAAETEAA